MKLHIENIHIAIYPAPRQRDSSLLASLAVAAASGGCNGSAKDDQAAPQIGEKWPGTTATYAGLAISSDEKSLVHLLLWDEPEEKSLAYDDAVKCAEEVNPEMSSHLPTRHQYITLFDRVADRFSEDYWYWSLTKTKSGKAAFLQFFYNGIQGYDYLSAECRVRAVSEIPL